MNTLGHNEIPQDRSEIQRLRRQRTQEAIAYARSHSPYYARAYQGLPDDLDDVSLLPVTDKRKLMARFDEWVTDPEVKLDDVRNFTEDPDRAGELYRGTYAVTTTSGTTGERGIYLSGPDSRKVIDELAARAIAAVGKHMARKGQLRSARTSNIVATHGHFGAYVGMRDRLRRNPELADSTQILSVLRPVPELVERLNEFRPTVVASYHTVGALLATEATAGRLRIDPAVVMLGGETIPENEYARIAAAFGCPVVNQYACNECPMLAVTCAEGWQHINEDWVIFEPVDADYRPTPPGELSHTVLISVLFRREQPILRYDLGDSITVRPDPCPCGDPNLPIRVRGRASDVLVFPGADGADVTIVPLAVETLVEKTMGVEAFQIEQTKPDALLVRLRIDANPEKAWRSVLADLHRFLHDHGLDHVGVTRATDPPRQSPGGKFRMIVPMENVQAP